MKGETLPIVESDAKNLTIASEKESRMLRSPTSRRRPFLTAFGVIALLYVLWTSSSFTSLSDHICGSFKSQDKPLEVSDSTDKILAPPEAPILAEKTLVPLEAHIMSKCPDAQDCLRMMVLPTMQRVIDKVNFTLSFIGTPTDNDGVACMHGPDECLGNIIELCAAKLYPDPKIYLGFTMCLTRDYKEIPDESLVKDCALEHGVDIQKLDGCAIEDDGGLGIGMLRESVRRSTQAGVTKSCTVRLNDEVYCVRDGRKWSQCPNGAGVNDLVIKVEKLYQELNS